MLEEGRVLQEGVESQSWWMIRVETIKRGNNGRQAIAIKGRARLWGGGRVTESRV